MALSFNHGPRFVAGGKRFHFAEITFGTSYVAGGEAVGASDFGLKNLDYLFLGQSNRGRHVYWNQSTGKLQIFSSTGAEHTGSLGGNQDAQKSFALAVGV